MTLAASFGTEFPLYTTRNVPVALECALGALMIAVRPATSVSATTRNKRLPRMHVPPLWMVSEHSTGAPLGGQSGRSVRHAQWPSKRPFSGREMVQDDWVTGT